MKVDICGTENGEQVAWVTVNKNGTVSFLNRQGDTSSCMLENGLKVPSGCSIGNTGSSQTTTPISTASQSSFSTAIGTSTSGTARVDQSPTPTSTSTPTDSPSFISDGKSATETPRADQSPTPIFTSTPTDSPSLDLISAGKSATGISLADHSPTLTSTPACKCSCESAAVWCR